MPHPLFPLLHQAILAEAPELKADLVRRLLDAWHRGEVDLGDAPPPEAIPRPGYPPALQFAPPRKLSRRGAHSHEGRAALFHAVAHIEFSAINLALDAAYRFRGLPAAFYEDWLMVAEEEVGHFEAIRIHLRGLGCDYGDLPAHGGLWEAACDTAHDPLERMALVPRYFEARGLDVNPGMQEKLREAGDQEGVAILEIILRDEIGHVARGDRWFREICTQRGLEPESTFRELVERHVRHPWRGPFHCDARRQAGLSVDELHALGRG